MSDFDDILKAAAQDVADREDQARKLKEQQALQAAEKRRTIATVVEAYRFTPWYKQIQSEMHGPELHKALEMIFLQAKPVADAKSLPKLSFTKTIKEKVKVLENNGEIRVGFDWDLCVSTWAQSTTRGLHLGFYSKPDHTPAYSIKKWVNRSQHFPGEPFGDIVEANLDDFKSLLTKLAYIIVEKEWTVWEWDPEPHGINPFGEQLERYGGTAPD